MPITSGNLTQGGYIATPTASTTPAQYAAAQSSGWTPTAASGGSGPTYQGGSSLPPIYGNQTPPPPVPQTINGGNLGSQNPLSAPTYNPGSSSDAFVNSFNPVAQTGDSTATPGQNAGAASESDTWKKQFQDYYGGLVSKLGLEGPEYQNLQQQYQIPQITQNLADVRGTIAQRTAAYTGQWQLANTEHAALPYITGEQTQIQRTQAVEIGMLTAQEQALSGNLQAANDIVDKTIQHEFEPIKNMISASAQWYQIHQNDLTESEKATFQLNSSLFQMNAQNFITTKNDAYKTAIQYGASQSTLTALSQAQNVNDVYSALSGITTGGNIGDGAGFPGTNGITSGKVVNGYDLSTYATDPQYAQKIQTASSTLGMITNTQQAQQAIAGSAPSSPITGQMIATAAQTYGVDPNMLASIMKVESNFGTLGVGAETNNPGNVGNTDSGATTKYKSWQDGVNAVAQQLQNRKVSVAAAVTNTTQQSRQQAVISTAPILVQPAMRFTSTGSAYIDQGKLDSTSGIMAKTYAARAGIPILDSEEVSAIQGIDTAMKNINSMQANFNSIAPDYGLAGKLYFKLSAPINKLFDTDYGASVAAYQSNRDNLFQQVSALAGSHPKLTTQELITAANALPKLNEWNTDTRKDGQAKIDIVNKYLDNAMKSILPTYQPPNRTAPVSGPSNTQWQMNADGTMTRIK